MKSILAMSLALVIGFSSTSQGAAVLPRLDGGPFDGVENTLVFTVTGTYTDEGDTVFGTGDTLELTYDLASNSGGPNLDLSIDFLGTVGSNVGGSIFDFSSTTVTLLGEGVPEANLLVDFGRTSASGFGSIDVILGLTVATIDPPISPGAIAFLPVGFTGPLGGFITSEYEFTLSSAGINGTGLGATPAGVISGSATGLVNPIPEPASLLTLLGCVAGVGAMGRRRRKAAAAA